jgi:hypothetical protein
MKNALLAVVLLVAAACGQYQFPGEGPSPTPETGAVSGRVIAVPCSPVQQQGAPSCAGRPVPSLEIDYVSGGALVARAVTDANGMYAVTLKPGAYDVRMKTYMRVLSGPLTLTVSAGSSVVANYILDSGIRGPVPQQ